MSIAIVTDSTSDIPQEVAESLNIHVVRNVIVIEGKSMEDGIGITREEFYQQLPLMKTPPTTATVSSGIYQELYENLFRQGYEQIISIHPSRLLSGVYNAAAGAAHLFGGKVHVIDSEQVTMGMGFQAIVAAEAAARGMTIQPLLAYLENIRPRSWVVAMLDSLEYIRRSGRVSWARASLGSLLKIKAFLEVKDGQILRFGETRTRKKGIARLIELFHNYGPYERFAILHTNAKEEAHHLLNYFDNETGIQPLIVNVTTVIGAHAGPGALGFAVIKK